MGLGVAVGAGVGKGVAVAVGSGRSSVTGAWSSPIAEVALGLAAGGTGAAVGVSVVGLAGTAIGGVEVAVGAGKGGWGGSEQAAMVSEASRVAISRNLVTS